MLAGADMEERLCEARRRYLEVCTAGVRGQLLGAPPRPAVACSAAPVLPVCCLVQHSV